MNGHYCIIKGTNCPRASSEGYCFSSICTENYTMTNIIPVYDNEQTVPTYDRLQQLEERLKILEEKINKLEENLND